MEVVLNVPEICSDNLWRKWFPISAKNLAQQPSGAWKLAFLQCQLCGSVSTQLTSGQDPYEWAIQEELRASKFWELQIASQANMSGKGIRKTQE